MRMLRPYGIYQPPGVVHPVCAMPVPGGYYLYHSEYGARISPQFEVNPDGSVKSWRGEPVSWRVEDLKDTGKSFIP